MPMTFAPPSENGIPLHVVAADDVATWKANLPDPMRAWADANRFAGKLGHCLPFPAADGTLAAAAMDCRATA